MDSNNRNNISAKTAPLIGPDESLPEITLKGGVLSVILIVLLAASNAYLGLKVGTTISAAIPAVVLTMGIFRFFRNHNVLEINIVQTAASVGEGITAGIAFTIPALIIMHFWAKFNYWETAGVALTGGILGILFSIPLRRALLADKTLQFPEGTAIGQVMKASATTGANFKPLVFGGAAGALISLFQTGFGILANSYEYWTIRGPFVLGYGMGFSPAVVAAGFICGVNVAIALLVGILIGWIFGIPILSFHYGILIPGHPVASANQYWLRYMRYIGVGTMLVGGLWTLVALLKPVSQGVLASFESLREIKAGRGALIHRTDRDIPINYVFWGILALLVIMFMQFYGLINPTILQISTPLHITITVVDLIYVLIAGFIFSSISGYFAGLVGATNSPGSGLLVAAQLILSLIVLLLLRHQVHFALHPDKGLYAAAFTVIVCSFIGAALVMTNESVQGLKAGQIVGGTPWKQQVVLMAGVIVSALVLPLILNLLFNAYGIGGVFPHHGMPRSQMLSAPQAGLIAAVAQGVFSHNLPWLMVFIGGVIAVICIFIDEFVKAFYGTRLPVLAVGLGIYLPLDASAPIVVGGILSFIAKRALYKGYRYVQKRDREFVRAGMNNAILLACGIVAGSTLTGVALAIPFALEQSADALRIMPRNLDGLAAILSVSVIVALCYWIYKVAYPKVK